MQKSVRYLQWARLPEAADGVVDGVKLAVQERSRRPRFIISSKRSTSLHPPQMQRKLNTPFKSSPMTKHQIEVITSVERRRRWSREEKERLVAATFMPETRVSEIARTAGIHVNQLFAGARNSVRYPRRPSRSSFR